MEKTIIEIDGHPGLIRDMNSKAVISKDSRAFESAVQQKLRLQNMQNELTTLRSDVVELKDTVNRLIATLIKTAR
jgi:hypothetical protein